MHTRPTTDRVREALFSILQGRVDWDGCRVLDLYAGTGALGLEALSRGAAEVCFVESRRDAIVVLRGNVESLGVATRTRIIEKNVERVGGDFTASFDVIFVDPPYAAVPTAAQQLSEWIAPLCAGVLVFEHAGSSTAPEVAGLTRYDTRNYGDSALSFFTR